MPAATFPSFLHIDKTPSPYYSLYTMSFPLTRHVKRHVTRRVKHRALITITLIALITVFIFTAGPFKIVQVQQESMMPTLKDGQWVLVIQGENDVKPGDIAVFTSPLDGTLTVKRCVLAGGTRPVVNHGILETPCGRWYLSGKEWDQLEEAGPLPENSLFMVGDNQFRSLDSRFYGPVPRQNMIGRVWLPSRRRIHG